MQKNNKKMTCLAAILMAALAALLIFAIVDANRINRSLSELQQTVNYEERLEPLLFYGATAETAETAATDETAKTLEPELNFTVTKSSIVPDDGSYVPVTLGDVTVCIPVAAAGTSRIRPLAAFGMRTRRKSSGTSILPQPPHAAARTCPAQKALFRNGSILIVLHSNALARIRKCFP